MSKQKYNLQNYHLAVNRKINGWTLSRKLGGGGNGEVWLCRNANKEEFAIKFLKWGTGDAYKRFYDEVSFMERYAGTMGVMPIIDKNIPDYAHRYSHLDLPYYYVMPLATPIYDQISTASFGEKIEIIKSLLNLLTQLHANGIAHRDIKPANILRYNGKYVFSDFGLVFFLNKTSKTPKGAKLGPRSTISPQMQRDAVTADKYKADVYSMAKTIWMIVTGDMKSFDGQYKINSAFGLRQVMEVKDVYWYPLEKLLIQCTDVNETARPSAEELEKEFDEWLNINNDWERQNLIQWQEVQEQLFPSYVPSHAEWTDLNDMISVLNLLGQYDSLNHLFFPDEGGFDLTGASSSYEQDCIELHLGEFVYIIKPKRLLYEYVDKTCEWNYFYIDIEEMNAISQDLSPTCCWEEFCEVAPKDYQPLELFEQMSSEDLRKIKPRHIVRYLRGSMVAFHKDSIYNGIISKYKGEHSKYTADGFRELIASLATKYSGETMKSLREKHKNRTPYVKSNIR